jgi:MOSC domain-containing protein YiiM
VLTGGSSPESRAEVKRMHRDAFDGDPSVVAVSSSSAHTFSKKVQLSIRLVEGLGVKGDAHAGVTVKHRSRVRKNPSEPNLRQVHLVQSELLDELNARGFDLAPGSIGENILTKGVDLLRLPAGSRLHIGPKAIVKVMGLRNPCRQMDAFRAGLMAAVLDRDERGRVFRKSGVMAVVEKGGDVAGGDRIRVALPAGPHDSLDPV